MEKKKGNILTIALALIIVALVAYIAVDKLNKEEPKEDVDNKVEDKVENEKEQPVQEEEKDITNKANEKSYGKLVEMLEFSNLKSGSPNNSMFVSDLYFKDEVKSEDLSDVSKYYAILTYSDELDWRMESEEDPYFESTVDANQVISAIKNLYGGEVSKYTNTIGGCPIYKYNKKSDEYEKYVGCGFGPAPATISMVYKITEKDNNTYVYVSVGYVEYDDETKETIYTDVYKKNKYTKAIKEDEHAINSSNYNDFSQYKYTFTKNSDGYTQFVKVEKLK